jgi:hypothetical protein
MKKNKIYIAGKITGENPIDCFAKFEAAEKIFIEQGFEVVNPMKVITDPKTPWIDCMEQLIPILSECTHFHPMPCVNDSRGGRIELSIAKSMKLQIIIL